MNKVEEKRMVSPKTACELYDLNPGTLANLRNLRKGPRFYKCGRRILYDVEDLEAWLKRQPVLTIDSLDDER